MNKKNLNLLIKTILLFSLFLIVSANVSMAKKPVTQKALAISAQDPSLQWQKCPDFLPCTFAILRGEMGSNHMDIFLKFPSKAQIPYHRHSSAEHMIMISGEFHTTYHHHEKVILSAGDYAYGPSNLAHDGYCASDKACLMFVAYETPLDAHPL